MGYKEEIFKRAEIRFGTLDKMKSWLAGFDKNINKYEGAGNEVYEEVKEAQRIKDDTKNNFNIDELLDLEQQADDNLDVTKSDILSEVRSQIQKASRAINLPRLPSQGEIRRTSEYSDIFADLIEEIASDKGLTVTNESEWDALSGSERGEISRGITLRLTGR